VADNTPRPYIRIDRLWFLDEKYRSISRDAICLHLGLIGLSSHKGDDGRITSKDVALVAGTLGFDPETSRQELLNVSLLSEQENGTYEIPGYSRWQFLSQDRAKAVANGSIGGKRSVALRQEASPSLSSSSASLAVTATDGFNLREGFQEAFALWPRKPGRHDGGEEAFKAYCLVVSNLEEHQILIAQISGYLRAREGWSDEFKKKLPFFANFLKGPTRKNYSDDGSTPEQSEVSTLPLKALD
jgi:hypothetical protein